ncbi:hypothetical protein VPNG_04066 [Cytospora leucostoma]|uniref:Aminoglycoside phosphotransferase domain-containing protein n=1 Tax=Cytospora leucostoma TaxID=1230097 RepID=A0A423XD85_9PEZI|nr:hypothetical protein VPNG_04066 [Cytospora leucostoma]
MSWTRYLPTDRLRWTRGYDASPIWPSDPDPTILKNIAASLFADASGQPDESLQVKFLADGARHKVYDVTRSSDEANYLLRVAIPLDPHFKLESEMATMEAVRRATSIPVPRPVAWSSSADNELGYEWCLVEKIPGVELREVWRKIPWDKKLDVVDQVAHIMAQLWSPALEFSKLGSIYLEPPGEDTLKKQHRETESRITTLTSTANWGTKIGPSVDPAFFSDRRRYLDQDRGPYETCHDWAKALIKVEMEYIKSARPLHAAKEEILAANPDDDWDTIVSEDIGIDEDDLVRYDKMLGLCGEYLNLLPTVFPVSSEGAEDVSRFSLFHCDLRSANIIVNPDTCDVAGIIDWEQSTTVPQWYNHIYPEFLQGDDPLKGDRHQTPDTYDSEDEAYNAVVVSNRDRWDGRLLRARFDKAMEELGWKDWKLRSPVEEAKITFLGGISDLADWRSAERQLEEVRQLLGIETEAGSNGEDTESSDGSVNDA